MILREREREREKRNSKIDLELAKNRKIHCKELVDLMPYNDKISWSKQRIKEFLEFIKLKTKFKNVIISFSGGKDSTVLLDLVLKVHKEIKSDLKLTPAYAYEITFPETVQFIKRIINKYQEEYPNTLNELIFEKPKLPWIQILKEKGYPIFSKQISVLLNRITRLKSKTGLSRWIFGHDTSRFKLSKKRLFLLDKKMKKWPNIHPEYFSYLNDKDYIYSEKCCNYIKNGLKKIKIPSFVGTMASESEFRKNSWIKYGCNVFNSKHLLSRPLSLFKNKDIWKYIWINRLDINPKYNYKQENNLENSIKQLNYKRLGCISCPYGSHLEEKQENKNRFQVLFNESKHLYESHVIKNGMYKILIDMDIKIPEDKKYMELYDKRWKDINDWNNNLEENLADIITQIENNNNYKQLKPIKNKEVVWTYTNEEIYEFYRNYDLSTKTKKIDQLINKYRKQRIEGK